MTYKEKYNDWVNNPFFDEKTRAELEAIRENDDEIQDRFYKDLEFGTAGLRGVMGAGTNRMNEYTVSKATQGLANFILKENAQDRGVVIAYDSRNNSKEFSEYAASTLNANGIKTYLFDSLRPTPELSYAVRKLNAIAGIVITASHNPSKYNGYKVYWEDGAQITSPKDNLIIEEVNKLKNFEEVKRMDIKEAKAKGLYNIIGKEVDDGYIGEIKKLVLNPDVLEEEAKNVKIVYTPLHGTGNLPVRRILKELGFENTIVVPEQEIPDGNFPTVSYPNPEDAKAFELALALAKKENADLVLATDPDADRLGVYAKDSKTGEYKSFTGNMSGLLIAEYILSQRKAQNRIPANGVLIKSIVSSNMAKAITDFYGIELVEVLTGFKYIGEKIKEYEKTGVHEYLFGYEESYGCLVGTHARDKDAVVAVMMLCEAAAYYKTKGQTLWDAMISMYEKYGYYKEGIISITLEGLDGAEKIKRIMQNLRENPIEAIGEYKVLKQRDYDKDEIVDKKTLKTSKIGLPKSNVLYYELENDAWCCVRPSGTEPKIKFYIGVKGQTMEDGEKQLKELEEAARRLI